MNPDLLIMAGARVAGQMRVSQPDLITENKVLVHIDVARRRSAKCGADDPAGREISNIFSGICQSRRFPSPVKPRIETLDGNTGCRWRRNGILIPDYVDPAALIRMLSENMQEDGIYVADVGQNQIWSAGIISSEKESF